MHNNKLLGIRSFFGVLFSKHFRCCCASVDVVHGSHIAKYWLNSTNRIELTKGKCLLVEVLFRYFVFYMHRHAHTHTRSVLHVQSLDVFHILFACLLLCAAIQKHYGDENDDARARTYVIVLFVSWNTPKHTFTANYE